MSDTGAVEISISVTSPSAEQALDFTANLIEDIKTHVYYPAFPNRATWERASKSGETVATVSLFESHK